MFPLLESEFGALAGVSTVLCGQIWDILFQGLELRLISPIFIYLSQD